MAPNAPYVITSAVAVGVFSAVTYYAYRLHQKSRSSRIPDNKEWKQIGTLKDICIYPVKSCGSIVVEQAECSILGLRNGWLRDRVLMVIDDENNGITARSHPSLLLIQTMVRKCILTLEHQDAEPLHINLAEVIVLEKQLTATVWDARVSVYNCGSEASEWVTRVLGRKTPNIYRIVYYASENVRSLRPVHKKMRAFTVQSNDTGALPDEVSYNLINEASVDDLNTRLKDCKVSVRNFRPNFVLSGGKPYDEDNWKFVKVGDNIFKVVKPCLRTSVTKCVLTTLDPETGERNMNSEPLETLKTCVLTTLDPETGERNMNSEPLETLKTYRLVEPKFRKELGNSPCMGLQMALRSAPGGVVTLNDPVHVAYK